jgi:hypothetical protein
MQTTFRGESDIEIARGKRGAALFFWIWLIVAMGEQNPSCWTNVQLGMRQ